MALLFGSREIGRGSTERTALSRNRTAMLEPTEPASPRAARESNVSLRAPESKASGKSKRGGRPSGKSKASGSSSRAGRPSGTGPTVQSPRSARHKKGLLRRTGIVFPAIVIAVVLVAAVTAVAYEMSPNGRGATALSQFMSSLPNSGSIAALEAEREQLIVMNAAAQTFAVAAKPATVDPASVVAAAAA